MTLFLAWLVLYYHDGHWFWWWFSCVVWMLHLLYHSSPTEFSLKTIVRNAFKEKA